MTSIINLTVETVQFDTTANVGKPRYPKEYSREGRNRGDRSAALSDPCDFCARPIFRQSCEVKAYVCHCDSSVVF